MEAGDLQINGLPAVAQEGSNAIVIFRFSQPLPGQVTVNFDSDAVITDQAGNPFDPMAPGTAWTYTLADLLAPAVATSEPAPGAVVGTLTQIELTFSESVAGVDAADLLINGVSAASVEVKAPDRYRFDFAQPASGTVTISWRAGHGIQDLSPAGNAFAGAGWSYTLNPTAASGDVVINEFLADNQRSIEDSDGQKEDWIELRNRGANAVSLAGWSLTDDPAEPGKWVFPNITLGAGQYLLVFASGKDRKSIAANATNHTNFRLSLAGGYLGLFNSSFPRAVASEFVAYPEQRADLSYGFASSGAATYFEVPTPRSANNDASAAAGFIQPPNASVKSGFFNQPFNLILGTETPGAEVRYTVDGSEPTTSSEPYTGPINIAGTPAKAVVTVRAAAFRAGQVKSRTTTRTYIFPDHVLTQPANPTGFPSIWDSPCTQGLNCNDINPADYEMDPQVITNSVDNYRALARQGLVSIPTVSIVTDVRFLFSAAEGVYVRRESFLRKPVNAEFITVDGSEGFQIDCGLEMQGQTSPDDSSTGGSKWKSLKLGLRLFFQGEFGPTKLRYKVFEDSPVDGFDTLMLAGGHNNYWNYNNNDTQRTRAMYVRDQYVANLQNALGGLSHHGRFVHLYLNGLYWGLYQLHERPDDSFQASYQGGEKEEYDVFKHDSGQIVAGSAASYTAMWAIINSGLTSNTNYERLQQYLDIPDLVNYMLVNFWANNTDWAHKNLYASHRKQGGKWRFHAWDSEHVIATAANDFDALNDNEGTNPGAIFTRLLANAEFRVLLGDYIHQHYFNGGLFYTDAANPVYNAVFPERNRPAHLFMKMLQEIDTAIVCESARWGDVGPGRETTPHTRNGSFYEERDVLMGYRASFGLHSPVFFPARSTNLLAQYRTRGWYPNVVAPSFNQHGGRVAPGFNLTIAAPAGTIYYTTNDADPRVYGSAAVSPSALTYSGTAITLPATTVVKARVLSGTNWSALNEATFVVAELVSPLRITEIMYNPPGGDAFEYIELKNTGNLPVDLGGHSFDGINFLFPPNASIAPGAILVLANNASPAAFAVRYPGVVVAGYFGGALANGGERIALKNPAGATVVSVTYGDGGGWPTSADGGGASLELIDPIGAASEPANWQASAIANGSPGQPNSTPAAPAVILNEVGAENLGAVDNAGSFPDWLELRNTTASPVNLAGWSLTDVGNARKFTFSGITIPANGYLVIWCDAVTNTTPGLHAGFGLDREGDSLFLYNAQTQRVDAITFGMQVANLSIGRVNGGWTLTTPTPAAENVVAAVATQSELSINEWMANAAPGTDDWLELYNRSASLPVSLRGIYLGTSNALFQVRSLSYLAPNAFVQLHADEGGGPNHVDFKLPAGGGEIALFDATATLLERVTYAQQSEAISQGRLPNGSATITSFVGSVSPGASNYVVTYTGPVLNEVLARNDSILSPWAEYSDWIELANTTGSPVNLTGMSVSDSPGGAGQWVFPAGATLPANGYLRLWCDGARQGSGAVSADMNTGFSLWSESGGVYLFNAAGQMVDAVEYGFQVSDLSIGRSGGAWRLLATPTPNAGNSAPAGLGAQTALKLNEWMSEPLSGSDWFEVYNPGALPVDLAGLYLTDDPSIAGITQHQAAPLSFIGAGGFVKFEADGDPSQGRHHVSFNLNRFGDALRLYAPNLSLIDSADLVVLPAGVSAGRLPDGAGNTVAFYTTPTPAESNYLPLGVHINEVLTHTDPPLADSIEILNPSGQPANLGGYFLSDSRRDLKKYRIVDGTSIAAGGFLVFDESQFNGGAPGSFALSSSRGGTVYLSAADAGGNLTGYRSVFPFGPQVNGVSFGRLQTSAGEDFPAMATRTLGSANSGPKIGPVVITEVMYHPVEGAGNVENADHEFVELHNISSSTVPLFDPANPANTWRATGGISFQFPTSVSLPARGYVLLVRFDPVMNAAAASAFRARYELPASFPLYGPFSGRLGNDGEDLALEMPDHPQGPGPEQGYVPYVVVDHVNYRDAYPWPGEANGVGASLQRRRTYAFGNDPLNWKGVPHTAGRANVAGSTFLDTDQDGLPDDWENTHGLSRTDASDASQDRDGDGHSNYEEYLDGTDSASAASGLNAPMVISPPGDQNVIPGQNAVLPVTVSGSAPLQYQWLKNGFPIEGATNSPLHLPIAGPFDTANYSVVVWNAAGFVVSRSARVTVVVPPRITLQPVGLSVNPGSNVTFTVAATGTGLVRYQWRFNGQEIPGAASPTLAINNAQLANDGDYVAMVTDDFATIASAVARLIVRVTPRILVPPVPPTNSLPGGYHSLVVPVGSAVTLSTVIEGNPPPFGYFWSVGAFRLPATISNSRTNTTTLIATNIPALNIYRLVVTNALQTNYAVGPWSATFVITTVADNDRDGLPDNYEVSYGLNTNDVLDATGDLDGDGMRNLDEYRAGTDPADSASYLRVDAGTVPGLTTVLVSAVSNRTYTVQYADDLNAGQWRKLGDIFARVTNRVETFVDPTSITNRFYRVVLPRQP